MLPWVGKVVVDSGLSLWYILLRYDLDVVGEYYYGVKFNGGRSEEDHWCEY